MKNKFIKTLSLCMTCLTLTLLLNVVTQNNNLKSVATTKSHTIISPDEWAPWI